MEWTNKSKKCKNQRKHFSNRNNDKLEQTQRNGKRKHGVLDLNFRLRREQIFTVLPHSLAVAKRTCSIFLTPRAS